MAKKLRGVNTVRKRLADGGIRVHYYHRDTGRPLRGPKNSPEFMADYTDAERSIADRNRGTVNGLIRDYTGSVYFMTNNEESTRKGKIRMLTKVEQKFGTMPIAALEDRRVKVDFSSYHEKVARESGPREADHRMQTISALLTWAVNNGQISVNHIKGFQHLHRVDRSDKIWLPEHVHAFMKVASVEMQQALIFALHTGQRQGDILRAAWTNYKDGRLTIKQGKTKRTVVIPCTKALGSMIDKLPRRAAVILTTKTGKAWKARYFKHQWEKASKAAGITELHFNDLRGTAVTMLAEAGCSVPQICAITGHSLKTAYSILERYLSRTAPLAEVAMFKFENAKTTKFANRLQTGPQKIKKGKAK